jgi:hypothetical protein
MVPAAKWRRTVDESSKSYASTGLAAHPDLTFEHVDAHLGAAAGGDRGSLGRL